MCPVVFWVDFWDEFESGVKSVSGCTFARTFTEAANQIEQYYGDDLISVKIQLLEECPVIEFKTFEEADRLAEN